MERWLGMPLWRCVYAQTDKQPQNNVQVLKLVLVLR